MIWSFTTQQRTSVSLHLPLHKPKRFSDSFDLSFTEFFRRKSHRFKTIQKTWQSADLDLREGRQRSTNPRLKAAHRSAAHGALRCQRGLRARPTDPWGRKMDEFKLKKNEGLKEIFSWFFFVFLDLWCQFLMWIFVVSTHFLRSLFPSKSKVQRR